MSFGMGMNQLLEITILKGGTLSSGSSRLSRRLACLFISASVPTFVEWNFGGIPVWLKYVLGISFRTDNELFKNAMQGFIEKIVDMMKSEKLFASQGGPIILSQRQQATMISRRRVMMTSSCLAVSTDEEADYEWTDKSAKYDPPSCLLHLLFRLHIIMC